MENNANNKAMFFAKYWGQKVLKSTVDNTYLEVVCGRTTDKFVKIDYLELRPLSDISDADAKHCSCEDADDFVKEYPYGDSLNQAEVDYLRSKGYALPFHDLKVEDLVNYGWIKLRS